MGTLVSIFEGPKLNRQRLLNFRIECNQFKVAISHTLRDNNMLTCASYIYFHFISLRIEGNVLDDITMLALPATYSRHGNNLGKGQEPMGNKHVVVIKKKVAQS